MIPSDPRLLDLHIKHLTTVFLRNNLYDGSVDFLICVMTITGSSCGQFSSMHDVREKFEIK